jgi:hypothetical protein
MSILIGVAEPAQVIAELAYCALTVVLCVAILCAKEEIKDWLGRKK